MSQVTVEQLEKNLEERDAKFTPLQLRFIDAYMADPERNTRRAAEAVGTVEQAANRWLSQAHIVNEIAYRENQRLKKGLVTVEKLTTWMTQTIRRCMQKVAIKTEDGRVLGYKFDPSNVIAGCRLMYQVFGVIGGSAKVEEAKLSERERTLSARDIVPLLREAQKIMAEEDGKPTPSQVILPQQIPDATTIMIQSAPDEPSDDDLLVGVDDDNDQFSQVKNIKDYLSRMRHGEEVGKVVD